MRQVRILGVAAVLGLVTVLQVFPPVVSSATPPSGFGVNLIVNPGAELNVGAMGAGSGPPPKFWKRTQGLCEVIRYGAYGGFPTPTSPGPPRRGNDFFSGGYAARSVITQTTSLLWAIPTIDAGKGRFTLSGYFGGYGSSPNNALLQVKFLNASGRVLGKKIIGPVTVAERANVTGLFGRTFTGVVPKKTRAAKVDLVISRYLGSHNDGFADNLSLVIKKAR